MGDLGNLPYFDDPGETLTDIARSYNVGISTIRRAPRAA
jgi:hypothetical protein